jgi:endonuclease YncB( thermonuclease family)
MEETQNAGGHVAKQFLLYIRVFRWHDGDTFYGILDQGRHLYYGSEIDLPRFRCARINAPELGTPEAAAATEYANKIAPPAEYQCWSTKLDEFGRPLIDLLVPGGLFSDLMLAAGHAKVYKMPIPFGGPTGEADAYERPDDPYGYLYRQGPGIRPVDQSQDDTIQTEAIKDE